MDFDRLVVFPSLDSFVCFYPPFVETSQHSEIPQIIGHVPSIVFRSNLGPYTILYLTTTRKQPYCPRSLCLIKGRREYVPLNKTQIAYKQTKGLERKNFKIRVD
jgi:hypothetical protein